MTLSKFTGKKCPRAFTLVEVVIVASILAVLVILSFAGVNQASASSRAALCVGNLRALGVGFNSYVSDHNGFYPDAYRGGYWPARIEPYVARQKFFCREAIAWEIDDAYFSKTVKKIPADNAWTDLMSRISYGYNYGGLAPDVGYNWTPPNTDPRIIKANNLARTVVLLADAGRLNAERTKGWGFYVMETPKSDYSMPLPRHSQRANILWTDGHIDQRKCVLKPKEEDPFKYLTLLEWDPRKEEAAIK
jgi:prepilin-type processing-associated H-X9-DG protein/prepilin-type N-terminal cleavage/methylation domain-containing protein